MKAMAKSYLNLSSRVLIILCLLFSATFVYAQINSKREPNLENNNSLKEYLEKKYEPAVPAMKKAPEQLLEKTYTGGVAHDYLIGSIYFSYDARKLGVEGLKQLASVAQDLSRFLSEPSNNHKSVQNANSLGELSLVDQYSGYRIKIIGYADTGNNSPYNLQLGLDRAEEVAMQLERFGIPVKGASLASYGDSKLYRGNDKFRKAEVWLVQAEKSSSMILLYVFLFFGMLIVVGVGFYLLIIQKR